MSELTIEIQEEKSEFRPGEQVNGSVSWSLPGPPESVELRLFWYTSGKGDQDVEIVEVRRFHPVQESSQSHFSFDLPEGPYTFSGRLISLIWALELVCDGDPVSDAERLEIIVSPSGKEVLIYT